MYVLTKKYAIKGKGMDSLEKVEVLVKLDRGTNITVVRHHYSVNKSMICYIDKHYNKICTSIKARDTSVEIPCV